MSEVERDTGDTSESTELASLELIYRVTSKKDKGKITIAIFRDFSKGFDGLNHKILLNKLSDCS